MYKGEQINSPEKLHQVMYELQSRILNLENSDDQSALGIAVNGGNPDTRFNFGNWKSDGSEAALNYQFGKFLGKIQHGDHKGVIKMGGQPTRWNASSKNYVIGKADLGTPLTGDASGTDAQYLVPQTIYDETIVRFMNYQSEVIPRLRRKTMTGRLHRFAVEGTEPVFTYVTNEVTDKTEQNPTWTNIDLECETFAYWVGVTDELMEDTFADMGSELRKQAVMGLLTTIETQALDGSGSPFTGILRDTSASSLAIGSIAFEDITFDDLMDAMNELSTLRKRRNLSFVMHPEIWSTLIKSTDANGNYFYDPSYSGPKTAWGNPVLLSDNMPDLSDTAADTKFVICGNLDYSLYGVRMGLEIRYFDATMYAVQDDENFFRFRTRFASKVAIPSAFCNIKTAAS